MYAPAGPRTIGEYARTYDLFHDVRAGSLRQYRITADLFERWAGRPVPLQELDEASVSAWLRDYSRAVRPHTVRSKRNQITALWRAAAEEGLCEPPGRRIRPVRVPRPLVVCWTQDEVERLLEACRGLRRPHRCGLPRSVWWDLAIRIAWDSGLRWGDQIRLEVAAIRPDGQVAVSQSKTGWIAPVILSQPTLEALRRSLLACPRDVATPWPASHETFAVQFRRIVHAAGVRQGTWKWLRRSSGTDCEAQVEGGARLQLGHRPGSRVAEESYIDPTIVGRRGVVPRPLRAEIPGVR